MPRPLEFDRMEVLEKAMKVFWAQGYESTSLDDLTAAMQIKRPSLYNSFGDKRSLYLEALKHYQTANSEAFGRFFNTNTSIKEGFKNMFHEVIYGQDAHLGCMMVCAATEFANTDEHIATLNQTTALQTETFFVDLLKKAQQQKEVAESLDINEQAALFYNTLIGLRTQARSGAAIDKQERIVSALMNIFKDSD